MLWKIIVMPVFGLLAIIIRFRQSNALARDKGLNIRVPRMPSTRETADIYVHHLVVVNTLCKLLGYKGLAIILDEAEHVRGFNVRRRERANNFLNSWPVRPIFLILTMMIPQ